MTCDEVECGHNAPHPTFRDLTPGSGTTARTFRNFRLLMTRSGECYLYRYTSPEAAKLRAVNGTGSGDRRPVEIACGVTLKRAQEILRDVGALTSGGAR